MKLDLMKHQEEGIDTGLEMLSKRKSILIADDMGLGKSVEAICILEEMVKRDKIENPIVLILCPPSLVLNWKEELEKWGFNGRYSIQLVLHREFKIEPVEKGKGTIIICGYRRLIQERIFSKLYDKDIYLTIADEAHYLSNHTAQCTQAVFMNVCLYEKTKKFIALSGTPIPNKVVQLWVLFYRFTEEMDDVLHREYNRFVVRYCNAYRDRYNYWNVDGASNLEELSDIMKKFTIRRNKDDVLKSLPPKVRQTVIFTENYHNRQAILKSKKLWELHKEQLLSDAVSASSVSGMPEIRQKLGLLKVPPCIEYVKDMINGNGVKKVIIFTHHRKVTHALREGLTDFNPLVIDGTVTSRSRFTNITDFKTKKSNRVLICNIKSGGVGFNLQECHHVIIIEPSWVPGENIQAEDRCYRKGQEEHVFVYYMLFKDSMDYHIFKALDSKQKNIEKLLDN